MGKKFKRVLVANRGEIAVRVIRTLREMGISPVALYSDSDKTALHVRLADKAYYIGPSPARESYLVHDKILEVIRDAKVDAVHPGYGFLSEDPEFARKLEKEGVVLIGPPASAMEVMGSKIESRVAMTKAGVPCVPGTQEPLKSFEEAKKIAKGIGYPVMLKASAGGGGKGMRLVQSEDELESAYNGARSEARNAFGDDAVYIEKAVLNPHHIEIQILSGPDGKAVWLGERECSMQRRHQKVLEETPSPLVTPEMLEAMGKVACKAADAVNYVGAGTVEFLADNERNFYFLEMNTRLQVEHPVTELCCGIDLVEAQVRVAEGEALPFKQEDIQRSGHSIEARVYAEDPSQNFMPCPGKINSVRFPEGAGIRVDSGVVDGFEVPLFYDPMIAKIIVWAPTRERALAKMKRALAETVVLGITTNIRFLQACLENKEFASGHYSTGTIARLLHEERKEKKYSEDIVDAAICASVIRAFRKHQRRSGGASTLGQGERKNWRQSQWRRGVW